MNQNFNFDDSFPEGKLAVWDTQSWVRLLPSGNSKFIHCSISIYM